MKREKSKGQRSFRLWEENSERLEYAAKLGFNVSEVVNRVLSDNLKSFLERAKRERVGELKAVMESPVP